VTDVLKALLVYLKADDAVAALVSTRVFGGELPKNEIADMPRDAVIVRIDGGRERHGGVPISRSRVEVWSLGPTYVDAGKVDRAVYDALTTLVRQVVSNVFLHAASIETGYRMVRDTITGWPAILRLGTVIADERSIT